MNTLVFHTGQLTKLRTSLLSSHLESAAFVLATPVYHRQNEWRLLVSEIVPIEDSDYDDRSSHSIEVPARVLAPIIKRARERGLSVVMAHTHPWDGPISPSPVDRRGEERLLPVLWRRIPHVPHARLIFGPNDTHAALLSGPDSEGPLAVIDVGPSVSTPPQVSLNDPRDPRFDRQVRAFGQQGQDRLSRLSVAVVGLGGTGSIVAQQLAHLGVRDILLIDPDVIEPTNLNRVVGAGVNDFGVPKVVVAERAILAANPEARVTSLQDNILRSSVVRALLNRDFFFACTDSHGSRAILTQFAYQYLIPGIDLGVRIQSDGLRVSHVVGRVQMLAPGLACLACSELLDPEAVRRDLLTDEARRADPYVVGDQITQPAVISLNTAVAGLAVTMFLAAIVGIPAGARQQIIFFTSGSVKVVETRQIPDCSICSPTGFLARGDSWPSPGRPSET